MNPASHLNAAAREHNRHLDEVVLGHIGRLIPRPISELQKLVQREWGEASTNCIYRSLRRLMKDGAVLRTADGYLRVKVRNG